MHRVTSFAKNQRADLAAKTAVEKHVYVEI